MDSLLLLNLTFEFIIVSLGKKIKFIFINVPV
jgi:hypothetical protein